MTHEWKMKWHSEGFYSHLIVVVAKYYNVIMEVRFEFPAPDCPLAFASRDQNVWTPHEAPDNSRDWNVRTAPEAPNKVRDRNIWPPEVHDKS